MAKDDFLVGLLQGLYQGGVGNPEVNNQRALLQFQQQEKQAELDMKAREMGMVPDRPSAPTGGSVDQSTMSKILSAASSALFPTTVGPMSLNTAFKQDPNAKSLFAAPDGTLSETEKPGSLRLTPVESRKALIQRAAQSQYVVPKLDEGGNVTGYTEVPPGKKPTSFAKPPAPKGTGKPGSSVEATFNLYETARDGLLSALGGTSTGYVSGRLPAFTAKQQNADQAIAAMAPVLKQLFRVSGEGVFTDRDQELLLGMIPTRKTDPKAIPTQIQNIDNIVRAKLGLAASGSTSIRAPGTANKVGRFIVEAE